MPVRFHIPSTFQIAGRQTKRPSPTQSEIRQIDKVRLRVPAVDRVYPIFLFTTNLIRAQLVSPAESKCTFQEDERILQEASHDGPSGKKKNRQPEAVPVPSAGVDPEDQTLADCLQQLNAKSAPMGAAEAGSTPG
ncbi:unnamed protein product [Prunus brigantina]